MNQCPLLLPLPIAARKIYPKTSSLKHHLLNSQFYDLTGILYASAVSCANISVALPLVLDLTWESWGDLAQIPVTSHLPAGQLAVHPEGADVLRGQVCVSFWVLDSVLTLYNTCYPTGLKMSQGQSRFNG